MSSLTPEELAEIRFRVSRGYRNFPRYLVEQLLGHIDHLEGVLAAAVRTVRRARRESTPGLASVRLAPKDVGRPRTQRVRVMVLIAPDGRYSARGYGSGNADDHAAPDELDWMFDDVTGDGTEPCDIRRHFVTADVPLHNVNAIEGTHAGEVTDE